MRRILALSVLLVACAPPAPPHVDAMPVIAPVPARPSAASSSSAIAQAPPAIAAAWTPEDALSPDAPSRFPKRALLNNPSSLAAGASSKSSWRVEAVVIEETAERLVMVLDDGGRSRFLLRRAINQVATVTTRAVALTTAQDLVAEPVAHVEIAPGVYVSIADSAKDTLLVNFCTASDSGITGHGWAPKSAVGHTFTPAALPAGPPAERHALVDSGAAVSNESGGFDFSSLGSPDPKHPYDVELLPTVVHNRVVIRLALPDAEITGFVLNRQVHPWKKPSVEPVDAHATTAPFLDGMQPATLRAGAQLFDDHGALVGITQVESRVFLASSAPLADSTPRAASFFVGPLGYVGVTLQSRDLTMQK